MKQFVISKLHSDELLAHFVFIFNQLFELFRDEAVLAFTGYLNVVYDVVTDSFTENVGVLDA
jgi:hypothetical protein